jgi:hypothetical protein
MSKWNLPGGAVNEEMAAGALHYLDNKQKH